MKSPRDSNSIYAPHNGVGHLWIGIDLIPRRERSPPGSVPPSPRRKAFCTYFRPKTSPSRARGSKVRIWSDSAAYRSSRSAAQTPPRRLLHRRAGGHRSTQGKCTSEW